MFLTSGNDDPGMFESSSRPVNVSETVSDLLERQYGQPAAPRKVFLYTYALLSSPQYRQRYANQLRRSFPRIPMPVSPQLLLGLAVLGEQLVQVQTLSGDMPPAHGVRFFGTDPIRVEIIKYDRTRERVYLSADRYFEVVHPGEWEFQIGCYSVLEKWLKDRGPKGGQPGRILSPDDILHYRKIVTAIAKTIALQAEIDRVIAAAGGFPDAFR
jgi:hypothetical protein